MNILEQFKPDFDEERAVSPVIGVILMVAITVILAAVIGTFVLGLGDQVESAPQASFDFQETTNNGDELVIRHRGGDNIDTNTVDVRVDGQNVDDAFNSLNGESFSAGDEITIDGDDDNFFADDESQSVDIVFTSGDRQDIIGSFTTSDGFGSA